MFSCKKNSNFGCNKSFSLSHLHMHIHCVSILKVNVVHEANSVVEYHILKMKFTAGTTRGETFCQGSQKQDKVEFVLHM